MDTEKTYYTHGDPESEKKINAFAIDQHVPPEMVWQILEERGQVLQGPVN